ncbi:hypothetical protein KC19_1G288800 [Ceratodon purpureus]|uniref:Uncharacterized protein n=1 Tax=Ceratodon purpureus TaxID=3225 RepID=A0A8T0JDD8_CERPU|nr:hypothetical protein KC19_1G288800 [Ceratodon purpureus]KAG0592899.1 hypothetical protein KC19_1G288800 [Ceratodon purpureus]
MERANNMRLVCVLALMLQLALWLGAPGAVDAVTTPVCETSEGSPVSADCALAINNLANLGTNKQCCNDNIFGSKCTDMTNYGTCKTSICINLACEPCSVVVPYLRNMITKCGSGGRVGGYQYMNENSGLRLQLSHT